MKKILIISGTALLILSGSGNAELRNVSRRLEGINPELSYFPGLTVSLASFFLNFSPKLLATFLGHLSQFYI